MTFGRITLMCAMGISATKTVTIARSVKKRRGLTMSETTKIVHRNDGLYDLTLKNGKAYRERRGLTMQEVVLELEREINDKEDANGRAE